MPLIILDGKPIQYEVARNARRKRLALGVSPGKEVVVRAPVQVSDEEIEQFIRGNAEWLLRTLAGERREQEQAKKRRIEDERGVIEYKLTRNPRRKRTTVFVHPGGEVEVRAPVKAPLAEIERFARSKADWIREKAIQSAESAVPERQYVSGETILYQGRERRLQVEPRQESGASVELRGETLWVRIGAAPDEERQALLVRTAVRQWLVERALEETKERLPGFAEKLGVSVGQVRIKDLKSRWGSCSGKGNISICFRLVMAPPEVMDYLFVHELCHLTHPNHSKQFWALVESVSPESARHKAWLKEHGAALDL